MKKIYCLLFFLSIISLGSYGQQEANYSMYYFNGLYINPAYAGSHEMLDVTAIYRNQWVKMPDAPQTASVAASSPLNNNHLALGLIYTYGQIGVTKTNSVSASFAYRFPVGQKKLVKLSFGLSAGFDNYRADLSNVPITDPNDPEFSGNTQNRWLPNVGAGVYVYSLNYYAGIAVPDILANRLNGPASAFATSTGIARQYQNIVVSGGYAFDIGKLVRFIPSVLFRYIPVNAPPTLDFNAKFAFIDRIWVGAGYRLNDSYNFMLAVDITRQVRVGYTYDLTVSPLSKYTTGTHEVMVSFNAGFKDHKMIKPAGLIKF